MYFSFSSLYFSVLLAFLLIQRKHLKLFSEKKSLFLNTKVFFSFFFKHTLILNQNSLCIQISLKEERGRPETKRGRGEDPSPHSIK